MHYVEEAEVTLSHCWLDYILNLPPSSDAFNAVLLNITDASHELSSFDLLTHFKGATLTRILNIDAVRVRVD